jgi:hypothetical protein
MGCYFKLAVPPSHRRMKLFSPRQSLQPSFRTSQDIFDGSLNAFVTMIRPVTEGRCVSCPDVVDAIPYARSYRTGHISSLANPSKTPKADQFLTTTWPRPQCDGIHRWAVGGHFLFSMKFIHPVLTDTKAALPIPRASSSQRSRLVCIEDQGTEEENHLDEGIDVDR